MSVRDRWLAAVTHRIERVRATGNLSLVLEPQALRESRTLARMLPKDSVDLEGMRVLGLFHWYRSMVLPGGRDRKEWETAVRMLTPCFVFGVEDIPDPLLPAVAEQSVPTARIWQDHDEVNLDLASNTVRLWQRILAAVPVGHPERAMMLANLALVLQRRFQRTGEQPDLDQAIDAAENAVRATSANDTELADRLHILGDVLWVRYKRTDNSADLDALITTFTNAVDVSSADHSERAVYLSKLGILLRHRYRSTRRLSDLDAAIEVGEAAAKTAATDAARATCLSNLGNALLARFEHADRTADVDAAIAAYGQATEVPAPHGTETSTRFSNLGNALRARFKHVGTPADLEAAITAFEEAVSAMPVGSPGRTIMLTELRDTLRMRFALTGRQTDSAAVSEADRAIRETAPTASALLQVLPESTDLEAISAALEMWRDIVSATPADHRDYAGFSNNLALVLRLRYDRAGMLADLDGAIQGFDKAAKAAPDDDPDTRAMSLSNLGNALRRRFERTGALADVEAAVEAGRIAMEITPVGDASWVMRANNLGSALRSRFDRTGDGADLDEAIDLRQAALDVIPDDDPDRMAVLTNLSTSLLIRAEHTGGHADLDAAIEAARSVTETEHPGRMRFSGRLGAALIVRFGHTGDRADLEAAIEDSQTDVDTLPANHPVRAISLMNLAIGLKHRWQATGASIDRDSALSAFAQAAETATATPSSRIHAATEAAALAAPSQPGRAAALLETAVRLLPQTAPRQLSRSDQQVALSQHAGLAVDAAALALANPDTPADERPTRALRLLEAGRAVLLAQMLATRSDLTDLREQHPELAARFTQLRDLLDQPVTTGDVVTASAGGYDPSTPDRHQMVNDFDTTLAEIRSRTGFASFALPPSVDELVGEGTSGPVVVINVSAYRSDALLLTSSGIGAVELPDLGFDRVEDMVNVFHLALHVASAPDATSTVRRNAQTQLHEVLRWLWDAAAEPVLRALGNDSGQPSRVWWIPGGMLGLLPLHAAGYHDDPPGRDRRTVMDRVVSSYTPTIAALRHARRRTRLPDPAQHPLIIAMPTTPGVAGRLHHVHDEVAVLKEHLPDSILLIEPDPEGGSSAAERIPTRANVLARLRASSIAHFACHGENHPIDPSQSRLLLHDHESTPLTVASLAAVNLDQPQLVYLSACRTAVSTAPGLFDEAVHLTSAFQLAGFPQVVGTLWEINDALAATVADSFYTCLRSEDGELDPGRAGQALHDAVRLARDEFLPTPSLWAAYLHVGT